MTWAAKALADTGLDEGDATIVAGRTPAWLIEHAVELVRGIREREGAAAVDRVTRDLAWTELRGLVVTLAAMVPADVEPARALEWVDCQPRDWTDTTVVREAGRWDAGARDHVAARGRGQWLARRADDALAAGGTR
jgi:hypothetical protein